MNWFGTPEEKKATPYAAPTETTPEAVSTETPQQDKEPEPQEATETKTDAPEQTKEEWVPLGDFIDQKVSEQEKERREAEFKKKVADEVWAVEETKPDKAKEKESKEEQLAAEQDAEEAKKAVEDIDRQWSDAKALLTKKIDSLRSRAMRAEQERLQNETLATERKQKYFEAQKQLVDYEANAINNADPLVRYYNTLVSASNDWDWVSESKMADFLSEQLAIKSWLSKKQLHTAIDQFKAGADEKKKNIVSSLWSKPSRSSFSPFKPRTPEKKKADWPNPTLIPKGAKYRR